MHRIALAAAIALIALTAAGCATAPTSPPPAAHATAAATTQPAAPVATPNKAAAVLTWYAGQGGRDMTKLGTAVSFASAASTGNPATEVAACQAIAKAVTAAQAGPPMPLASAERWYRYALAHYARGAADCQARHVRQRARQFLIGNYDFSRVIEAVQNLSSAG